LIKTVIGCGILFWYIFSAEYDSIFARTKYNAGRRI